MKTIGIIAVAALALAAHADAKLQKVEISERELRGLSDEENRQLMHYTVEFEECVGQTLEACQEIIQAEVLANPGVFEDRTQLEIDVMNVRTSDAPNYNQVGLRTNFNETGVVGVLGDGMIFYPWDWCIYDGCYTIGPWDCDVGTPLSVDQCCNMIKTTVPHADVNGNELECYADLPIGSVNNPVDYGRVCIHVNSHNIVIRAPKNE